VAAPAEAQEEFRSHPGNSILDIDIASHWATDSSIQRRDDECIADEDHIEYLRGVREKMRIAMQAAEERITMQAAEELASSRSAHAAATSASQEIINPNTSGPSQRLLHEVFPSSSTGDGPENPLAHLTESRQRLNDLLSRMSIATDEARAIQERATMADATVASAPGREEEEPGAEPEPGCKLSIEVPYNEGALDRSIHDVANLTGEQPPSSPSTWLMHQRARTASLLGRLRLASENQDVAPDVLP
jgi:hypothetical protein